MNSYLIILGLLALFVFALGIIFYSLRQHRITLLYLTPVVTMLVSIAYWHWGSWPAWQDHVQQQIQQQRVQRMLQSVSGPQALIDKMKARLNDTPESAQGWYLLGRLYGAQDQWQLAHDAFIKAYQLKPDNEQYKVNYALSLVALNHQQLDIKTRGLFQAVLQKNTKQPDALAMLAMDAYRRHAYQQAIDYWQRLLSLAPTGSDAALAIRKAIAKAQAMKDK